MEITKFDSSIKVAVDTGGANTKYAYYKNNEIQAKSFPTICQRIKPTDTLIDGIKVHFAGDDYVFRNSSAQQLTRNNSKLEINHVIAVYTAIAQCIKELELSPHGVYTIDLAINVPLSEFKNKHIKEEYVKQYEHESINIEVDDQNYSFIINKVRPYFEGQGALLRDYEEYESKKQVLILDLGGRNITICLFKSVLTKDGREVLQPQNSLSISDINGLLKYLSKIATELGTSGTKHTIDEIQNYKMRKLLPLPKNFKEVFDAHIETYLHELNNKLISYEVNYDITEVVVTGGGAILLKDNIKDYFENEIPHLRINSKDGQFDNVKGALRHSLSE